MIRGFRVGLAGCLLCVTFAATAAARPPRAPQDPWLAAPGVYVHAERVVALAHRGDPRAQAYLGFMYQTGRGVPQHFGKAAHWYLVAADSGEGYAQFALGLMYDKGQGVPVDLIQAYKWVNLSAAQSRGDLRDFRVRIRDIIASKMTADQRALAQHLAQTWYRRSGLP